MIDWIKIEPDGEEPSEHRRILIWDSEGAHVGTFTRERGYEYWSGTFCNLDHAGLAKSVTHWSEINTPLDLLCFETKPETEQTRHSEPPR